MSGDDDLFAEDDAATPLTPEERRDLIPTYVALRRELNEVEALNVADGERWALSRKRNVLDEVFLQRMHLRMFGDVWRWAGKYRSSERNIGVASYMVPVAMRQTIDDAKYWVEQKSWPSEELAVRFAHKLVSVHPFPNGNGRWSRLAGDLLAIQLSQQRFTWGSASIVSISDTRRTYVQALKKADDGDIAPLLIFARS